jgi:hypothetical protein
MTGMGHGIAIDGSERQLWVDGGPSCVVQKSAAVGGEPTFANTVTSGYLKPKATLHGVRMGP